MTGSGDGFVREIEIGPTIGVEGLLARPRVF